MKKILRILAIIAISIVAAFIGWTILKLAIGIIAFLILFAGILLGWWAGRVIPKRTKKQKVEKKRRKAEKAQVKFGGW